MTFEQLSLGGGGGFLCMYEAKTKISADIAGLKGKWKLSSKKGCFAKLTLCRSRGLERENDSRIPHEDLKTGDLGLQRLKVRRKANRNGRDGDLQLKGRNGLALARAQARAIEDPLTSKLGEISARR